MWRWTSPRWIHGPWSSRSRPCGRRQVVLAAAQGANPVKDLVSDQIVNREVRVLGARGVDYSCYSLAVGMIESGRYPIEKSRVAWRDSQTSRGRSLAHGPQCAAPGRNPPCSPGQQS
jgi:hypothetical protein